MEHKGVKAAFAALMLTTAVLGGELLRENHQRAVRAHETAREGVEKAIRLTFKNADTDHALNEGAQGFFGDNVFPYRDMVTKEAEKRGFTLCDGLTTTWKRREPPSSDKKTAPRNTFDQRTPFERAYSAAFYFLDSPDPAQADNSAGTAVIYTKDKPCPNSTLIQQRKIRSWSAGKI